MKIFITYRPCRERNYHIVWIAKTGNIITTSAISKEQAVERHKRKLERLGYNLAPLTVVS